MTTDQNKKNQLRWRRAALVAFSSAFIFGCSASDGADGMDGTNGAEGMDGNNGTDGNDGEDGNDGADGSNGADGASGDPGADGSPGENGAPGFAPGVFYLSNNGPENAGMVQRMTASFDVNRSFSPGNNEGIVLTKTGALIQAGDPQSGASIRTFCAAEMRAAGATFQSDEDSEIAGALTGLVNPKGIALAEKHGLLMIANFNDNSVLVFGSSAAGNSPPLATTTLESNAWDLAYDETNDRLFVAQTNGTVAVFDSYVAGGFSGPADRTMTVVDDEDAKISVNLHGIAYDRASDRLVVSDVGDAASATDGALFVLESASSADGNVVPSRSIAGDATWLGNPVDIVLSGTDLRVAEKAGDALLIFTQIFDGPSGNVAPALAVPSVKPESLAELTDSDEMLPEGNDVTNSHGFFPFVTATSNPGSGQPTEGLITRMTSSLSAESGSFDSEISLESVVFDKSGDAYATYDDGSNTNGGIFIANRIGSSRLGEAVSTSRDRMITGASTMLVSPKGLDISSFRGLVFVAENNAATPGVLVFSACAAGDAAPLAVVSTDGARPWDVDYDEVTDRLFVALTDGTVGVYDSFSQTMGAGGSDRILTPSVSSSKVSVNLHGIDYDPMTDSLLLSDVGDAGSASDGQLFVLPAASTSDGLTEVSVQIGGIDTWLGNPVDIAYDGQNLFVAEKSNDRILRFDDILRSPGGNQTPDSAFAFSRPESVALNPGHLFRAF